MVSKSQYHSMVRELLSDIALKQRSDFAVDTDIEKGIIERFAAYGLTPNRMVAIARRGVECGEWFFPFLEGENKFAATLYTSMFFAIDDLSPEITEPLGSFCQNLLVGRPQKHPLLRLCFDVTLEMNRFYGRFASDMILKSMIEFLSANLVEVKLPGKITPLPSTPSFPRYFRLKSGMPEAFAFFPFPTLDDGEDNLDEFILLLPDLIDFIDAGNDILSFYKESILSDDRENCIHQYADAHCISPAESLIHHCDLLKKCVSNLRASLLKYPRWEDNLEQFIQGYLGFHIACDRYHLADFAIFDT
ncbi:terpenoid synthase [Aspergillus steynii IBT 23096]|uniref:Terpenoid synthase n=1 Tax=Aspergillus steynii IBT 23096 TaxID=1392250 RepID=A0A2I2G6E0_9EURO|nr:terpenoid synthase [Aspergillus steynii IBT 23096]PLB48441.1 terpenoid synthase [Aspergillus steynii IBT 23096]